MIVFLQHLARLIRNVIVLALCACVAGVVLLSVAEIPLPARVLVAITARLSSPSTAVHVERATVSLRNGLSLDTAQIRMNLATNDLFVQAREIRLGLSIRPGRPWTEWIDGIRLIRPEAAFLPPAAPRQADGFAPGSLLNHLSLSRVFLELDEPLFCGIAPARVTADLSLRDPELVLDNIRAVWRPADTESLAGSARFNPGSGAITVEAAGRLSSRTIRPILVLAQSASPLEYCDRITSPDVPLAVSCDLRLTPETQSLRFEISGRSIAWNAIPLTRADCVIAAVHPDATGAWRVTLSPLLAETADGSASATLVYTEADGVLAVEARAEMPPNELLNIVDVLNDGVLDRVRFRGAARLTLSGTLDADSTRTIPFDLKGTLDTPGLSLFGLPLTRTTCAFTVRDQYLVSFDDIRAGLERGGEITGRFALDLTRDETDLPFETDLAFSDATLHDLFRPFSATNTWEGGAAGDLALSGNLATNTLASLAGGGSFAMTGGVISRVPLFAGFTDYLARNIPGVETLVSQSDASFTHRIEAGVLHSDDLLVEGDFFSISGKGAYDLARDDLGVTVRANIFRRDTIAGRVTRIITLPFNRLLLEFRVAGPAGRPRWEYKGIIQRIVGSVVGSDSPAEPDSQDADTP